MPDDEGVGYKRPPAHTRFKPGRSGNPTGRPKGTKNLKTDLAEELGERILVREGERARSLSKQRALLKSLMAKAIKGDTKAANLILTMVLRVLQPDSLEEPEAPLSREDRAILEAFERRVLSKALAKRRSKPAPTRQTQHRPPIPKPILDD